MLRIRELFASLSAKDGADDPIRIRAAIGKVEDEQTAARDELSTISTQRTEALLSDDDPTLDKLDRRAEALHRTLERCEFAIPELQTRLSSATAKTAEVERVRLYDAAITAARKAEKQIVTEYPSHARAIVELLGLAADAQATVERANRNLPEGRPPINLPDVFCRGVRNQAEQELNVEIVELWTFDETGEIVRNQDDVVSSRGSAGSLPTSGRNVPCTRKRFRETKYYPASSPVPEPRLDELVMLPGLMATNAPFWRPGSAYPEDVAFDVKASLAEPRPLNTTDRPREMRVKREPLD